MLDTHEVLSLPTLATWLELERIRFYSGVPMVVRLKPLLAAAKLGQVVAFFDCSSAFWLVLLRRNVRYDCAVSRTGIFDGKTRSGTLLW